MMTADTRGEIRVGEIAVRFLLVGEESGGAVTVFEFDVPAGSKVAAPHSHDGFEETIYGLEGALVWTVEGETHEVGAGEVLCIPRGAVHQFANTGNFDASALAIATPASSAPNTSAKSPRSSRTPQADRPTWRESPQ